MNSFKARIGLLTAAAAALGLALGWIIGGTLT
jgi:hypothetical protein